MNDSRLDGIVSEMLQLSKNYALENKIELSKKLISQTRQLYDEFNQLSSFNQDTVYDMELTRGIIQFQTQYESTVRNIKSTDDSTWLPGGSGYIERKFEDNPNMWPQTTFESEFVKSLGSGLTTESIFYKSPTFFGKMKSDEAIINELNEANVSDNITSQYQSFLNKFHLFCDYLLGEDISKKNISDTNFLRIPYQE